MCHASVSVMHGVRSLIGFLGPLSSKGDGEGQGDSKQAGKKSVSPASPLSHRNGDGQALRHKPHAEKPYWEAVNWSLKWSQGNRGVKERPSPPPP